jgi:hypothetical protein
MDRKQFFAKYKDPRWQKKRLEILTRDGFTCQNCKSTENQLHVHHKLYFEDYDPWDYPDYLLITYCCDCHEFIQDEQKIIHKDLIEIFYELDFDFKDIIIKENLYISLNKVPTKKDLQKYLINLLKNKKYV